MRDVLRRLPRWALATWAVLVLAVVLRVAGAGPNSGTVVPIYLKAGERWIAGADIYAAFWPLDIYRNPPGVAAFFAPWSLLPPKTAGILWRLLGLGVYATGLVAGARVLLRNPPVERLGLGAVLAALLVIPSFNNGQVNVLIVGCLLHALAGVARGHLGRAAGWVAFASFFKVYPLAVGLLFCVAHPKFALRLLPLAALAALLPFACQRPDYVADMHRSFVAFMELEGRHRLLNERPPWDWTILPRAGWDLRVPGEISKLVSAFAGLAFAGLVMAARRQPPIERLAFAFGLGGVWMTLFGPATENATYTLIAPVVAAMFVHRPAVGRSWATLAGILFALPILRGLFPSGDVLPFRTAQPLGALLVLALLVRERFGNSHDRGDGTVVRSGRVAVPSLETATGIHHSTHGGPSWASSTHPDS